MRLIRCFSFGKVSNSRVNIYDPATQEISKMGLGDGAVYFSGANNSFLCGLKVE